MTESKPTLIFDYDGTLHNSGLLYPTSFRLMYQKMVEDGVASPREWKDEEINNWLGYNAIDMWNSFLPNLSREQQKFYSRHIGCSTRKAIAEGKGMLYPHAEEVLETLRQRGYRMVVLSNCEEDYLEAHSKSFGLDRFFDHLYASATYGFAPKYETFAVIQKAYGGEFAVIGDRIHDMELARRNGLPAVGCRYGFGKPGELDYAAHQIDDLRELLAIFP